MWFYRTDDTYFIYVILLYLWLVNINQIRYTIFIRKGGERIDEMTDKELITILIDKYTDLQRIKKANNDTPNEELDYQIKTTTAKLSSMGINVEDLTL